MSAPPAADRTREVWAAGDYQRVGVRLVPAAEQLVADLGVRPGDRVLDVGGGTGNAALAAARRDGDVVCSDIVPEIVRTAPEPAPYFRAAWIEASTRRGSFARPR